MRESFLLWVRVFSSYSTLGWGLHMPHFFFCPFPCLGEGNAGTWASRKHSEAQTSPSEIFRKQDCKVYWKTHLPHHVGLTILVSLHCKGCKWPFHWCLVFSFCLRWLRTSWTCPSPKRYYAFLSWPLSCKLRRSNMSWIINLSFCVMWKYRSQIFGFNFMES